MKARVSDVKSIQQQQEVSDITKISHSYIHINDMEQIPLLQISKTISNLNTWKQNRKQYLQRHQQQLQQLQHKPTQQPFTQQQDVEPTKNQPHLTIPQMMSCQQMPEPYMPHTERRLSEEELQILLFDKHVPREESAFSCKVSMNLEDHKSSSLEHPLVISTLDAMKGSEKLGHTLDTYTSTLDTLLNQLEV